ncbi:MAG TPA: type II toxin-antitoxin system RelE/ParE family toxin [Pyrinomonadaceae bacterium]|nr:type II toxin-antitoxin system RelE/ParE family toxin [Pyrinomonadaceae bacterium]HMP64228.1 type II toxin-antitoxin system RelE/ParE family toxin [Pyrinomonadaceae bacterium]
MRRYKVEFTDQAVADLDASFEWGCEAWGPEQAAEWYFEMRDRIREQLTRSPLACPLAPQQQLYTAETRVLVIGRYNVLFHFDGKKVTLLHIRGPFRDR